jgi:hypothetical protein
MRDCIGNENVINLGLDYSISLLRLVEEDTNKVQANHLRLRSSANMCLSPRRRHSS